MTNTKPTTQSQTKEALLLLSEIIQSNLPLEQSQIWAAADPFANLPIDKDLSILDSKIKIELLINPVFGCYKYANEETQDVIDLIVTLHKAYIYGKGWDKAAAASAQTAAASAQSTAAAVAYQVADWAARAAADAWGG